MREIEEPAIDISLRDLFAAFAIVGKAAEWDPCRVNFLASEAYFLADAMLDARDLKPEVKP